MVQSFQIENFFQRARLRPLRRARAEADLLHHHWSMGDTQRLYQVNSAETAFAQLSQGAKVCKFGAKLVLFLADFLKKFSDRPVFGLHIH
jgi:hypothetical protein